MNKLLKINREQLQNATTIDLIRVAYNKIDELVEKVNELEDSKTNRPKKKVAASKKVTLDD